MAKTSNADYLRMETEKSQELSFSNLKSNKKSTGDSLKPIGTLRDELKALVELDEDESISI